MDLEGLLEYLQVHEKRLTDEEFRGGSVITPKKEKYLEDPNEPNILCCFFQKCPTLTQSQFGSRSQIEPVNFCQKEKYEMM